MKEKGIKNLIIDFGGVLIDLDRNICGVPSNCVGAGIFSTIQSSNAKILSVGVFQSVLIQLFFAEP